LESNKYRKRVFFIISIIIHILLLIIFFAFYKYSQKKFLFPKKPAKVIFKKPQPKPPPPKPKPKQQLPAYQGIRKPAPKPEPKQKPKSKTKPTETLRHEPKDSTQDDRNKKNIAIKKASKKIDPTPKPKLAPKPLGKKPEPKPKPPKKTFTLTDLSKGFLDYSQKHGANLIQYTNSAKGMPTEEQLKHERYISKVFSCIETSLKIKRNTLTIRQNISPNEILTVLVQIVLNTNGKINYMKVAKTSGIAEFDNFMVNIVNESSSSFPPVPSYLSKNSYHIPIKFFIPAGMVMAQRNTY